MAVLSRTLDPTMRTIPKPLDSIARMVPHSPSGCAIFCIAIGATKIGEAHDLPANPEEGVKDCMSYDLL